jgi:hypothetical protein
MALVGEARIKVVADTKHIREEIQKAFAGMEKDADKAGNNVSKSFNKGMSSGMRGGKGFSQFQKESIAVSKQFQKAIRSSYKWQAATGALLQSVMALGGGLLALAGNIAGAAASGIALVGMMAQIKLASMVAKSAFKGVMAAVKKDSAGAAGATKTIKELREEMQQLAFAAERAALSEEAASIKLEKAREELARAANLPPDNRARREAQLAYSEAELAYRMAKDKNDDAQDELLNPKKKKKAGDDPYKDLTASQREFAIYLKQIMPEFKRLNEAAARGFLPVLRKQMEQMFAGGTFNDLVDSFAIVSMGLGEATEAFAQSMFSMDNRNNLITFADNARTTIATLGNTLGKAFGGFLNLMVLINPLITRFTAFLDRKATNFAANMKGDFANIQMFFKNAGDAAAGWGEILGRIFEKFKGMIKANVGPGTGGQLLLDFFRDGAAGFRGLDGAAGEFARKQHFLASAMNLKAMLESLGRIFGFMKDLGTNPAVASFWNILAELEGPLSDIFDSISGSSDELARLLVTIVEIVSTFADADQLNTYMKVLSDIFAILGGIAAALAPVFALFGKYVGLIGAIITITLLLKKVTMLTYGVYIAYTKVIAAINIVMKAKRVIDMSVLAVERAKNIAAAKGVTLTHAQMAATMKETVANRLAAITKAANAAGNVALGVTSGAAVGPVAALGVAVMSITWPVALLVAAFVAVIAIIAIMIGHMNAVKADNIKKANKEIQKSFKDTKGEVLGAAAAQDQWNASLLSLGDGASDALTDVRDLGKILNEADETTQVSTQTYNQAKEAINVYMGSLAKLAKKDLPEAQRQLRNMVVSSGMNRQATMDAILANKDLVKSLEAQANAMGDTIMGVDGQVNALKALDYAIAEGSFTRRQAILEQQKFAETFKNAAATFIDDSKAMQDATKNGKLNIDQYVKNMKNQGTALLNWRKNVSKLNELFTDKTVLQGILAQGSAGAALVDTLADGGADAVKKYTDAQKEINKAKADADLFTKAYSSVDAVAAAVRKKYANSAKSIREDVTSSLNDAIGAGKGAFEIAANFGIGQNEILAQQRLLDSGVDLAKGVSLTATWDKKNLETIGEDLQKAVGNVALVVTTNGKTNNPSTKNTGDPAANKDGGYIKRAMGGLVAHFADGFGPSYSGRVSGPGTGRSDQIPAMISNGEFVVNARATASNLDLLNAINNNKGVGGAGNQISITVNAAPGMDEQQVAAQVARQLDAQLSRGGSL